MGFHTAAEAERVSRIMASRQKAERQYESSCDLTRRRFVAHPIAGIPSFFANVCDSSCPNFNGG